MARLTVDGFSISLDGYGAGPDQSLENPLGVNGRKLHEWFTVTRTFRKGAGEEGGETNADDEIARRNAGKTGAAIMGRNMFGPIRGPWTGDWRGWWGQDPPFHAPVFVLTHYRRGPLTMGGGTVFHFVTEGIEAALEQAAAAAGGKEVGIWGGAATIRQYLQARLIDEMRLVVTPVLLGAGEPLLAGLDLPRLGYRCTEYLPTNAAAHVIISRVG